MYFFNDSYFNEQIKLEASQFLELGKYGKDKEEGLTILENDLFDFHQITGLIGEDTVDLLLEHLDRLTRMGCLGQLVSLVSTRAKHATELNGEKIYNCINENIDNARTKLSLLQFIRHTEQKRRVAAGGTDGITEHFIKCQENDKGFKIAASSFTGLHTHLNSDAYLIGKVPIIAAVFDGVSGSKRREQLLTGKFVAETLARVLGQKLKLLEQDNKLSGFAEAMKSVNAEDLQYALDQVLNEDLKDGLEHSLMYFSEINPGTRGASTFACAIDLGDRIALYNIGDGIAFAYDENGVISDTENEIHSFAKQDDHQFGLLSSIDFKADQDSGDIRCTKGKYSSLKIVDKSKCRGFVLSTDGNFENYMKEGELKTKVYKNIVDKTTGEFSHVEYLGGLKQKELDLERVNQEIFAGIEGKLNPVSLSQMIIRQSYLNPKYNKPDDQTLIVGETVDLAS